MIRRTLNNISVGFGITIRQNNIMKLTSEY